MNLDREELATRLQQALSRVPDWLRRELMSPQLADRQCAEETVASMLAQDIARTDPISEEVKLHWPIRSPVRERPAVPELKRAGS